MLPRRTFVLVGHGDFKKTGEEFLGYFTNCGLQPEHNVLDIGCGIGRMAIPLTRFLKGRYEGFEYREVRNRLVFKEYYASARKLLFPAGRHLQQWV